MAEHTPRPWEVRELLPDGVIIRRAGTYQLWTREYDVAADVPGGGPFRKLADAQLASAAPDLLAACEEVFYAKDKPCPWCGRKPVRYNEWLFPHADNCAGQAAIAKARGE